VRVCRQCYPDQTEENLKRNEALLEATTKLRRAEFDKRKAREREDMRSRREEIRQRYARAPSKK